MMKIMAWNNIFVIIQNLLFESRGHENRYCFYAVARLRLTFPLLCLFTIFSLCLPHPVYFNPESTPLSIQLVYLPHFSLFWPPTLHHINFSGPLSIITLSFLVLCPLSNSLFWSPTFRHPYILYSSSPSLFWSPTLYNFHPFSFSFFL